MCAVFLPWNVAYAGERYVLPPPSPNLGYPSRSLSEEHMIVLCLLVKLSLRESSVGVTHHHPVPHRPHRADNVPGRNSCGGGGGRVVFGYCVRKRLVGTAAGSFPSVLNFQVWVLHASDDSSLRGSSYDVRTARGIVRENKRTEHGNPIGRSADTDTDTDIVSAPEPVVLSVLASTPTTISIYPSLSRVCVCVPLSLLSLYLGLIPSSLIHRLSSPHPSTRSVRFPNLTTRPNLTRESLTTP